MELKLINIKILFGMMLLMGTFMHTDIFAQQKNALKKPVSTVKKPPVNTTSTTTQKKVVDKQEQVKAPLPPTAEEIQRDEILNTCNFLIKRPMLNYSFYLNEAPNINWGVDSISYEVGMQKNEAVVKLKDDKQHTIYKLEVQYDTTLKKVEKISIYAPKELQETYANAENKKYQIALHSRYEYNYLSDTLTQILQFNPPYETPRYSWELKNTADSCTITQYQFDNRRIFAKVYLNRENHLPDSAFYNTYSSFTPYVPELYGTNYYNYTKTKPEKYSLYGQRKATGKFYNYVYDSIIGKLSLIKFTSNEMINYSKYNHLWIYMTRNSNKIVEQKKSYSFVTEPNEPSPLNLPENLIPTIITYSYNEAFQVRQMISFYEDKCITKKITTDYILNNDGFIVEFKNNNELQTRCSY